MAALLEQLIWMIFSKVVAPWAITILKKRGIGGQAEALAATAALTLSEIKTYHDPEKDFPHGRNGL